jgi:menaquinone-dependent protoporphyrinogen IX oxidase
MKGAIVYQGKYGATSEYAHLLSKELNLPIYTAGNTDRELTEADYILIGSAVYIGKLSIQRWLFRNREWLKSKKLAFFIVCGTPGTDREKTSKIVADNIPPCLRDNPVFFLKGRLIIDKLSWTDRLLLKLGARFTKDPAEKRRMLTDFDGVKVSALRPVLHTVQLWELEKNEALVHTHY